ncbi:MAG: ABC transporter substrate-binding protein [Planctomycetes bacterium]|nr:ABC transporter substrate-binding protein [Planctomycetota bacterium]
MSGARSSIPRLASVVAVFVTVTLYGCDKPPTPPPAQPARHTAATRGLRDWVCQPAVAEADGPPQALRIISAAPNITEVCCALGLRSQLVGRTRYCVYPPGIETVPSIGALIDTNIEALLDLRPELVLLAGRSRSMTERLAPLGLRLESLPDNSLADVFDTIERVGALTGRSATARQLCAALRADLDHVARRFADVPRARVLLLIGTLADPPTPPFVAGPGSFYDDLLRRAGHDNIVPPGARALGPLSLEFILRSDPDVIIELDADGTARPNGSASAQAVWRQVGQLQAVKTVRIYVLTGPEHFLAGPRIAHTFEKLCRLIAGQGHD